jgi:hypothetical protein
MHGDLSDTTLAAICRALASDGATGRLVLDADAGSGSIAVRGGAITDVRSSQPRARLAGRLTGGGHLDELTLARVLQDLRDGPRDAASGSEVVDDTTLARELLERGVVDPLVIEDVLVGQIVDGMVELSARRRGRFDFEPSGSDPPSTSVGPVLEVATLLAEVGRREERLAALPPAALRPDTVPRLHLGGTDGADHLGADGITVLGAIDDRRSLRELARDLGYGVYDLACILADLSGRGFVTLSEPPDDIDAALDLALKWSEARESTPSADGAPPQPSGPVQEVPDLVDAVGSSASPAARSDAPARPRATDPAAAPGTPAAPDAPGTPAAPGGPEPSNQAAGEDAAHGPPDLVSGRVEGDADVSEFLRELSWLAQGDDAPPRGRSSTPTAGKTTDPKESQNDGHAGSTTRGAPEDPPGAPRSRREPRVTDEPADRRDGQRRRRWGLFGRG